MVPEAFDASTLGGQDWEPQRDPVKPRGRTVDHGRNRESEQKAVLVDALQSRLAVIMGVDGGLVDPEEPLADLGLDSLMALELLDGVELVFGVVLEIEHVVENPTLSDIADAILAHLTNQVDAAAGG